MCARPKTDLRTPTRSATGDPQMTMTETQPRATASAFDDATQEFIDQLTRRDRYIVSVDQYVSFRRGDTHLPFGKPKFNTPCAVLIPDHIRHQHRRPGVSMMGGAYKE
jgi:hypothetical protein